MRRELIIIDGFNLIFRVFYAVPAIHNQAGIPVNALFGYMRALMKILAMDAAYVVIAFDSGGETFRTQIDPEYKAHRDGMPSDLGIQMELIMQATDLLQIPRIAAPGFEADDIIGTLVRQYTPDMELITIVTSDKDMFQLIGEKVLVYDAMKDQIYGHDEAVKKFEIEPKQIVDYLALIGDTADNIPGVRGIGPKTAVKLLQTYGTLDTILDSFDTLSPKLQEQIGDGASARMSQKLATIHTDVPYTYDIIDTARMMTGVQYTPALMEFLQEYEFHSLMPTGYQAYREIFTLTHPPQKATREDMPNICRRIQNDEKYSLVTYGHPCLTHCFLAFSTDEVYHIDTDDTCLLLCRQCVEDPRNMQVYDAKNTLRSLLWFQTYQSAQPVQQSLL